VSPSGRRRVALAVCATIGVIALLAVIIGVGVGTSPGNSTSTTTSTIAVPTSVPYNPLLNARADVTTELCLQGAHGWTLRGTVHNGRSYARRYQIIVDYTSIPGSTVLDTRFVNIAVVASHQSVSWSATGAAGLANVNCVIRFVQAWRAN